MSILYLPILPRLIHFVLSTFLIKTNFFFLPCYPLYITNSFLVPSLFIALYQSHPLSLYTFLSVPHSTLSFSLSHTLFYFIFLSIPHSILFYLSLYPTLYFIFLSIPHSFFLFFLSHSPTLLIPSYLELFHPFSSIHSCCWFLG